MNNEPAIDGEQIRRKREAMSLTIADLSIATAIDEQHLIAMEENRWDDLPSGPYRAGWLSTICETLELELDEHYEPVNTTPSSIPLVAVRAVAAISILIFFTVGFTRLYTQVVPATPVEEVPDLPDQKLIITARSNIKVQIWLDEEPTFEGRLVAGTKRAFEAHDSIRVQLPRLTDVRLNFNGQLVVPQGRQDQPRLLTFMDDGGKR